MSISVIYLLAALFFLAGVSTTLVTLSVIESRTLRKPGARVAIARQLVADSGTTDAWRAWCAAQPQSATTDDSYLDIHQWGVR